MSIERWITEALDGSGWTFDEVMSGVAKGDFHLFRHPEAVMVTEFIVSPRHKVLHVWAAGGSLAGIDALVPVVEAFGKAHKCDAGGATGRKGWLRYLKKFGYSAAVGAVEKELH